ncbi:hypothetical protein PtA15_13A162 [Puccinia triticina]|uniref:Uncharacterized protein n=1 Tax=Puccinia triticina TaxID=208348 RepID=A0ABY7D2E3_9BASI|nr:uncharacterized protein PtA15_13A162 [Puccinia triticina]WAQ90763.1 hypothetical protein PtA15_13A162 [Puccinia triticina]
MHVWAPDLEDLPDSLYNKACRQVALKSFRQAAVGGAFAYMNIQKKYAVDLGLLIPAYTHFVHYLQANWYNQEKNKDGKFQMDKERKVISKAREQFTHQFFDTLTKPYDLTHEIENHDEDNKQTNGNDNDNDNSSFKGEEIDLANSSSEEEEEPKENKEDRAFVDDLMDTTNTHPGEHQGKDNEEELAREVCYNAMLLDEDKDLGPAVEINKSFNIQAFLKHALKAKK